MIIQQKQNSCSIIMKKTNVLSYIFNLINRYQ